MQQTIQTGPLEHPIVDTDWYENKNEHHDIPHHEQRLAGHKVREELLGEGVELVTGADEDEASQEDVDDGVVWYEDQDPVSVGTEPDVVLSYHHLYVQATDPGKEAGVAGPHEACHVPQQCEADDGNE